MPKINPQEVAAQVLNRKVDRVDIQMLVCLEKANEQTLRLDDRIEVVKVPPLPTAPKGAPMRSMQQPVYGLESQVNQWCDERPDLTVKPQADIELRDPKTDALVRSFPREPVALRFSISRLERMTSGSSECPAFIEHVGGADEETAKKPTRFLMLSPTGEVMLALWRGNKVHGVPFPDPEPPFPDPEPPSVEVVEEPKKAKKVEEVKV